MRIHDLLWPQEQIDHIAAHNIAPEKFEEVCFGESLILRIRSEGQNPVYHVLGQTAGGDYLLCIVIQFPEGKGYPVTARAMTEKEIKRYKTWKR